mgnify:CR=1 FL=1
MLKKVNIGGLVYSVSCQDNFKLNNVLESFCTEKISEDFGGADCQLSIFKSRSKILSQKSRIKKQKYFETEAIWGLYELTDRDKILSVPSLRNGNRLRIFSEFDPNFRNGTVYISDSGWRSITYPFLEILTIQLLALNNGVLLHACAVSVNEKGYLFVGQSGAGKSTIANLWKKGKGATILSDDRIIVRKRDSRFWIYGTPWHGDAKVCSSEKAPLEKLFFLKHAKENSIKRLDPLDVASRLIVCSFPTFWDKKGMEFTLNFCSEIAEKISCYELGFVPGRGIIDFLRDIYNIP